MEGSRLYFAINPTLLNFEVSFQAKQEINCKLSLLAWVVQFDMKNHKGKAFNIFHENARMISIDFSIFTFHNHCERSTAPAGFKVIANESSVILLVLVSDWKEHLKATHCCAIPQEKRQALKIDILCFSSDLNHGSRVRRFNFTAELSFKQDFLQCD